MSGGTWAGRRVLVTGGAGFIGAGLCHALDALDAEIVVLDNFLAGGGAQVANLAGARVTLLRPDLRDADLAPIVAGCATCSTLPRSPGIAAGSSIPPRIWRSTLWRSCG